jgi:hypothetical protein
LKIFISPFLIAALVGSFLTTSPVFADDDVTYPVSFVRPMEKGHVFSCAALAATHEDIKVSWEGSVIEEDMKEFQCELAAAAEVIETNEEKIPTHIRFRVFWLKKRTPQDGEVSLLEKGTEVEMFQTSDGVLFQIGTEAVKEELHQVLALIMRLPEPKNDAIFGSKHERKVGDTWPVNNIEAAGRFLENGLIVQPDDLAALVRFRELSETQGTPCMDVAVEMKADNVGPTLPEGFKLKAGTLEVLLSGKFPVDPALPMREETSEFLLDSEADGRVDGKLLNVKTKVTRTYRARWVPFGA